ncbi:MAG: MFS transporter [Tetrasphaera sp.]|nr:MFS transporter [Tetrasphaera sp.]
MTTQVFGASACPRGATVGSLLAEKISGRTDLAGLGGTFQTFGAALLAVPIAALAQRAGRRPSLTIAYLLAVAGAVLIVLAAALSSFAVFLLGSALLGSATAANSAARYAATDLALPEHRGRDLSLVVWVTTVGSVLGPNLAGPAQLARALHLDVLVGPFVVSAVALTVATTVMWVFLRPDPLLLARALTDRPAPSHRGSLSRGMGAIRAHRQARLGVVVMALGHIVMVAVMVMTPLHLRHGHATLTVIGLVISGHILGMFAFAPLMGLAADRFGAAVVSLWGGLVLVLATGLAGIASHGYSHLLALGLFLLGLGWSATFVAGSLLLVSGVAVDERPAAQGVADLVMGLAAAAGVPPRVVVERLGYARLAHLCLIGAVLVVIAGWSALPGRRR